MARKKCTRHPLQVSERRMGFRHDSSMIIRRFLSVGPTSSRQCSGLSIPASGHRRSRPQPAESTGILAGIHVALRSGVAREGDRENPRQTESLGGYAPTLARSQREISRSDTCKHFRDVRSRPCRAIAGPVDTREARAYPRQSRSIGFSGRTKTQRS